MSRLKIVAVAWLLLLVSGGPIGADEPPEPEVTDPLARFEPFLNKTWKGLVDPEKGVYDVARWERAIGGKAIRMTHSVGEGAYGGETIVVWDRKRSELVYYYFTTAGFYTHGSMRFEGEKLTSVESVEGHADGVTEVMSTQELTADGKLKVRTEMLRGGAWEDRGEVLYASDPEARLILPAE